MSRLGDLFWGRFLLGLAIIPILLVVDTIRRDRIDELTPAAIVFFLLWEAATIALARWRRVWPFADR